MIEFILYFYMKRMVIACAADLATVKSSEMKQSCLLHVFIIHTNSANKNKTKPNKSSWRIGIHHVRVRETEMAIDEMSAGRGSNMYVSVFDCQNLHEMPICVHSGPLAFIYSIISYSLLTYNTYTFARSLARSHARTHPEIDCMRLFVIVLRFIGSSQAVAT